MDTSLVQLTTDFDRAWRRVGLWRLTEPTSPSRTAIAARVIYFVRYVVPVADKSEPGFFGKLLGTSKAESAPKKYRVLVVSQNNQSTVSVQNADGTTAIESEAQRIVSVLAEDLK
jgi:outer membrane protein assembly factor BamC